MLTFAATKRGYLNLWKRAQLLDSKKANADKAARYIINYLDRYEAVAKQIGKPGLGPLIGAAHWREASGSFAGVLHNGEKIIGTGRKTRLQPPNRGPFSTWEDAAVDALKIKGWDKIADWPIERWLYEAERFNGWGYALYHNENSSYVWAATTLQQRGKYTSDGNFDRTEWDQQLGVAAILLALFAINPSLVPKSSAAAAPIVVVGGASIPVIAGSIHLGDPAYAIGAAIALAVILTAYAVRVSGAGKMPFIFTNWKTSLAGAGIILTGLGTVATQVSSGAFDLNSLATLIPALLGGLGLLASKDGNVTGGTVKQ